MRDGGPAFPRPASSGVDPRDANDQPGMTLRDYFAAQALVGVLSARATLTVAGVSDDSNQESIAEECFELADAMLAERGMRR